MRAGGPSDKMTGLQHLGFSCYWGEEFFLKRLRYRKVNATIEFRTKGKPRITLLGAREDFIDRVTAEMDLERETEISHVDHRRVPCFRERKQHHNISGNCKRFKGLL